MRMGWHSGRDPHEVWDAPHLMGGDVGRGDPLAGGGFAPNPPKDSPEGGRRRHLFATRFPVATTWQTRPEASRWPGILMVDGMDRWPTIMDENGLAQRQGPTRSVGRPPLDGGRCSTCRTATLAVRAEDGAVTTRQPRRSSKPRPGKPFRSEPTTLRPLGAPNPRL